MNLAHNMMPTTAQRNCRSRFCSKGTYTMAQIVDALEQGSTMSRPAALQLARKMFAVLSTHLCTSCTPDRKAKKAA